MNTATRPTRVPLWQRFFTNNRKAAFVIIATLISVSGFAHSVTGYTGSCVTGPHYSLDAIVANVNSSSNYAWQYKNSSGNWVCIVNGNNTINGFTYSVSGATSTATTNPAPIVFNNPNNGLDGLIIRCVISDGAGVNPCNMPSGNTWNSNSSSVNHTIDVTNTPCGSSTCNADITNVYFNKLDGGADITITSGGTYTTAQLGSLYNIEASTTGTVGSVRFTITGPTASTVTENAVPYNTPGTGNGAWVGAPGSYTLNVKVYTGSDATGTVCDEVTKTFTVSNDCSCPSNVLLNPSFENTASNWTVSGGTLTFGTSYEMCGSYNGFLNWSSGTAKVWQDVTVSAGSILSFKGYAGTHAPGLSCSPKLSLIYLNSSNGVISQSDANVTYDVGSGSTLALYTINATAPAGTVKVRVQGSISCNTLKVDGFCLTVTPGTLTLGNLVWHDEDADGIADAGEDGVPGVSVKLYNDANNDNVADGASVATTTTNATGNYSFTGLNPGNYIVGITIPAGFLSSGVNGGDPDNNTDNDDNGQVAAGTEVRGLGISLSLGGEPGGSTNNTYDFGLINDCECIGGNGNALTNGSFETGAASPWSVSGGTLTFGTSYAMCGIKNGFLNQSSGTAKLWQDVTIPAGATVNFKGYAGTHTPGMSCSPKLSLVFLNSANAAISQVDAVVTRDVDGAISYLQLYTISAVTPAGTVKVRVQASISCNTLKVDGFCLTYTIPLGEIGDFVWQDLNNNGAQDLGEPGIPNVTVTLRNSSNVVVGTTTTNTSGIYSFTGLVPDTYSVTFDTPAGYLPTSNSNSEVAGDELDSDPIGGVAGGIILPAGGINKTIDAGFIKLINLSGNVWHDVDAMNDGFVNNSGAAQVPPAAPIPSGIRAYLVNTATNLIERITPVNAVTGTYGFANVTPNTVYQVIISTIVFSIGAPAPPSMLPTGWQHTGQKLGVTAGSDPANDGKLLVPVNTVDVINANFGIRRTGGDVVIP